MSPVAKRARTLDAQDVAPIRAEDDFDEFDVPEEDLLHAVEDAEKVSASQEDNGQKEQPKAEPVQPAKPLQPAKPVQSSLKAPAKASDVPSYTLPYAGTPDDPLALERTTMNKEWFDRLEPAMRQDSFAKLKQFLDGEKRAGRTIYPPPHLIHSWSRTTPLEQVKVVIVGQDPYHQPGQACGHSFSVPMGIAVPASLRNIYKELSTEYPDFAPPKHGCLEGWAKQGVLLLNACLVRCFPDTDGECRQRRVAPQPGLGALYARDPQDDRQGDRRRECRQRPSGGHVQRPKTQAERAPQGRRVPCVGPAGRAHARRCRHHRGTSIHSRRKRPTCSCYVRRTPRR